MFGTKRQSLNEYSLQVIKQEVLKMYWLLSQDLIEGLKAEGKKLNKTSLPYSGLKYGRHDVNEYFTAYFSWTLDLLLVYSNLLLLHQSMTFLCYCRTLFLLCYVFPEELTCAAHNSQLCPRSFTFPWLNLSKLLDLKVDNSKYLYFNSHVISHTW